MLNTARISCTDFFRSSVYRVISTEVAMSDNGSEYRRSMATSRHLNSHERRRRSLINDGRWRVPARPLCGRAARDRRSLWKPARSAGDSTARGTPRTPEGRERQRGATRLWQPAAQPPATRLGRCEVPRAAVRGGTQRGSHRRRSRRLPVARSATLSRGRSTPQQAPQRGSDSDRARSTARRASRRDWGFGGPHPSSAGHLQTTDNNTVI
jgi:hypothetical protein